MTVIENRVGFEQGCRGAGVRVAKKKVENDNTNRFGKYVRIVDKKLAIDRHAIYTHLLVNLVCCSPERTIAHSITTNKCDNNNGARQRRLEEGAVEASKQ